MRRGAAFRGLKHSRWMWKKNGTGDGSLNGDGFRVEKYGIEIVKKAVAEPFDIQYVTGDDAYLEMMDRELLEGKMPEAENEMAADVQTLRNLGVPQELGAGIELDGETFLLSGILTEMPEKLGGAAGRLRAGLCKRGSGLRDERKLSLSEVRRVPSGCRSRSEHLRKGMALT